MIYVRLYRRAESACLRRRSLQQGPQQNKGDWRAGWGNVGMGERCDQPAESQGQEAEVRLERKVGPGLWARRWT